MHASVFKFCYKCNSKAFIPSIPIHYGSMNFKQVIAVRKDLKLTKGKLAAQASHASVGAFQKTQKISPVDAKMWESEGGKKVVVYVENEKELFALKEKIPDNIATFVVRDAGLTHLEPGTVTCIGIGPAENSKIDKYTSVLKLVS